MFCASKRSAMMFGQAVPKLLAARLGKTLPAYPTRIIRQQFATKSKRDEQVIVALGGNALLQRGEEMIMENQRKNILSGVDSLKSILSRYHGVTLVHGNGPQSGLLVLESAAYEKATGLQQMSLDFIVAETQGMIAYSLEQAMAPHIAPGRGMATLLSQIVVDPDDPAFQNPTKFIGPVMTKEEAEATGLPYKSDGKYFRRVVPSPLPLRMIDCEMQALKLLTRAGCIVVCAGGGGIPVVHDAETDEYRGIEAVIDKDRAATMVGEALGADGLIILTDVTAVALNYDKPERQWIRKVSPGRLASFMDQFPDGSMGPKCASAIDFVQRTGGWAVIGSLKEAEGILAGEQGTRIENSADGSDFIELYENNDSLPKAA